MKVLRYAEALYYSRSDGVMTELQVRPGVPGWKPLPTPKGSGMEWFVWTGVAVDGSTVARPSLEYTKAPEPSILGRLFGAGAA